MLPTSSGGGKAGATVVQSKGGLPHPLNSIVAQEAPMRQVYFDALLAECQAQIWRNQWCRLYCGVQFRGVAQLGSARRSGRRGRRFKSSRPDCYSSLLWETSGDELFYSATTGDIPCKSTARITVQVKPPGQPNFSKLCLTGSSGNKNLNQCNVLSVRRSNMLLVDRTSA